MKPVRLIRLWWLSGLVCVLGCQPPADDQFKMLHQKADRLETENKRLERQLLERDGQIADLRDQVAALQALGPDRLSNLFVVDRIELVSLTGGADYDGVPGDDGVTVYLRPVDADGNVLKAAGEIIIELLDTSVPGAPRSLGQYIHNDPEQLRKLWYSGIWTDHYTIRCAWSPDAGKPRSREVLVKANFNDFLTGRRFTAAKLINVSLAGE